MIPTIRALVTSMFIAATLATGAASAPPASPDAASPRHVIDEHVGAYEVDPERHVIVTYAPTAEELLVLDFDELNFSAAAPRDEPDDYATGNQDSTGLRFLRDDAGEISGLRWTIDDQAIEARRLDTLRIEEVSWSLDDVELAATVMIPAAGTPVPAAVIAQGAGDSDRENIWAQAIAAKLARSGIAVLLPDKRGSGKSTGQWRRSSFTDLARDALTARDVLATKDGVDPRRIGIVGLSQGGWVAPLAAFLDPSIAFAVGVSSAVTTPHEQVLHEISQDVRRMEVPDEVVEQVRELIRRKHAAVASIDAWPAYRQHRETLVTGGLQQLDEAPFFPRTPGGPDWTFWQLIHDFDPMPLWTWIRTPSLIVYGREDERDNVPVARCERMIEELKSLHPERDLTCFVFEGTGHALWESDRPWGALRDDFTDALVAWLRDRLEP